MWVLDMEEKKIVQKRISYVPGLYKIFDEILVNAADNKQRDPKMKYIKVTIDKYIFGFGLIIKFYLELKTKLV